MSPGKVVIRPVAADDHEVWLDLWEKYLVFYEATLPAGRSELLWRRINDPHSPVEALVAETDGRVVGIVHFFPHPDTWEETPVCYLQDLFVDAGVRGGGVGEKLIRAVQARCAEEGWADLYWQTAEDNVVARGLYDKLTGGRNRFVVYQMDVKA